MVKHYIREDRSPAKRGMLPVRFLRGLSGRLRAAPLGDTLFQGLCALVAIGVVALLAVITLVLALAATPSIRAFGFGFLGGTTWNSVMSNEPLESGPD